MRSAAAAAHMLSAVSLVAASSYAPPLRRPVGTATIRPAMVPPTPGTVEFRDMPVGAFFTYHRGADARIFRKFSDAQAIGAAADDNGIVTPNGAAEFYLVERH